MTVSNIVDLSFPTFDKSLAPRMQQQLEIAKSYVIDSQEMFDAAAADLLDIKKLQTAVAEQKKSFADPLNAGLKTIFDFFREPADYLLAAEKVLKAAMNAWLDAQEKKAEEERAAKEAKLRAEREAAEKEQHSAVPERNLGTTAPPVIVVTSKPAPKTSGISRRKVWKGEVTDKLALIKYIVANPDYIDLLDVNTKVLNDFVQLRKGALAIDGVRAFEDSVIAARSK